MSATIFIAPGVQIIPQPDFEVSRPTDNAGWVATQSFLIQKGKFNDITTRTRFAVGRAITDLDPSADSVWGFLRLRSISVIGEVGGWQRVRGEFSGFPEVDANGNPIDAQEFAVTYALRAQSSDAPIYEHPKFRDLDQREKIALGKLLSGEWSYTEDTVFDPGEYVVSISGTEPLIIKTPNPIQSDEAKDFAIRIAQGVSTYRKAGYTWTKRWDSRQKLDDEILSEIGKKETQMPGQPPTPDGRDWMLVSAQMEQVGEDGSTGIIYNNELIYELSDDGGWDTFLYAD
jgi:hypothetical protein